MILETIRTPADVKALPEKDLPLLCEELRKFLIQSVSETGGHLASNLGAVELTVAIHRVFDTASDRLVFDVGHQCYFQNPRRANTTRLLRDMPPTLFPWLLEWQGLGLYKIKITIFWP